MRPIPAWTLAPDELEKVAVAARSMPGHAVAMLRALIIALIRFYQRLISPFLPAQCRYKPTCSQYGIEALRLHGFFAGTSLLLWRVLRCAPWGSTGDDPVPDEPWVFRAPRSQSSD